LPEPDTSDAHAVDQLLRERERIRSELGGSERVAALRGAARPNVRERIDALLDSGSFREVGTFARSANDADADATPGDGKIGGHGLIDGCPVTVVGDDITVKRGSSSPIGSRKLARIFEQALAGGQPFVYLGETGGARIPDSLGSTSFSELPPFPALIGRRRRIPMATAIVGESFGGSSFVAALSDFVVQVRGSCMAVTSPHVIEMATGEPITMDDLGGVDVGARITGQIDLSAETEAEALQAVRTFLGYLPSAAGEPPPRHPATIPIEDDPEIAGVVPERRSRAYDMRRLLAHVLDDGELFELKPLYGRGLVTGLGRLDGHPVGVIASQPKFEAGALTPAACDKATRLVLLCDAFRLPLVMLQDTPGFMVGRAVEHERVLGKAMMFAQALLGAGVPKLGVVLRKAFGLAFFSMGGPQMGMDFLAAWPGAEIGFMDPRVGANVLAAGAAPEAVADLADRIAAGTDPMGPAGIMAIDDVIAPAETRRVLAEQLARVTRADARTKPGPLSNWPTCW